ncbi:MAG TPA: 4-hydroxy-3-methylbut-2-enyl diphosphate reductase [Candidatus Limnocylindria bacterium]|jgi:4-hydroxy-3-methylbut-2-enyl diphosphate reductase
MTTATPTEIRRPEVRIAERAGFCYGVRLAIDKAKHAREQGEEVTTLGQLVHNPGIKADLSDRGIRTADLADQVEGGTLVIRAHGVPASEMDKLRSKAEETGDLQVIDATCTWVLQSQKAARELADAGYTVCIIGHEDHPEVKGVRSYAGERHVVVDDMDRTTWERVPRTKKLGVLSQSTILPHKLEEFAAFCLRRCHDLRVVNTVCPVTLTRQDDSVRLAAEVDAMVVVGGKNSSNTRELAVKCAEVCDATIHVADADELAASYAEWLRDKPRIGITGGTSTPEVDLEEVRERIYALTAA